MKKDKEWLLEKYRECIQSPKTGEKMLDEGYELALSDMLIYINQLDEPQKPVIPKFVANWIDEFSLQGSNPLKVYKELSKDFSEGWTTDEDARVYHWISRNSKNTDCFIDSLRYGYEIERND